jgi:hypothetical protein
MDEFWRKISEDLAAKLGEPAPVVGRATVLPPPLSGMNMPALTVTKFGHVMPVSEEILMNEGLIPDTRPPVPLSRRLRFRWWWRARVDGARLRVGSWVAGVDLSERDDY